MTFFTLNEATTINSEISKLPIAEIKDIIVSGKTVENRKAVVVNDEVIDISSSSYVLKQHEDTFRPIISGLTMSGIHDFKYSLYYTLSRARLNIYVDEVSGVNFGFQCLNSFDRTSSINYGFRAYQKLESIKIVEKTHVLVWGFRKVCSNGMMLKIPLKTSKYLDSVVVTKIRELLSHTNRIIHTGNVTRVNENFKTFNT